MPSLGVVAAWPLARTIWFSFTDANINDRPWPGLSVSNIISAIRFV